MRNLYDNLINRKEKVSFHMPGHKGKMLEGMNDFLENILKIDVTELSDTDDLYHANNIIAEGRNNLALFFTCKKINVSCQWFNLWNSRKYNERIK